MRMTALLAALAVMMLGTVAMAQDGGKKPAKDGQNQPALKKVNGKLTDVKADSITVEFKGDGGVQPVTLGIDANTKIQVQTAEMETVAGKNGETRQVPKFKDGTAADLQVGGRVQAARTEDNKAVEIRVLVPENPKAGKEVPK